MVVDLQGFGSWHRGAEGGAVELESGDRAAELMSKIWDGGVGAEGGAIESESGERAAELPALQRRRHPKRRQQERQELNWATADS